MASVTRELTVIVVIAAMLFFPGGAILVLSRTWQRWSGLQRLFVAAGLSVALYPVLFYMMRFLLPQFQLGRWFLAGLLALGLVITIWGEWKERIYIFRPDRLEWAALIILGLTLASRFWFAHDHPFPAWSDSLHHTLLTDLTAESGRLPRTLEPYFPNVLDMYHLGLYALSGAVQILSGAPAHTALLWTAQFLNGLCGIGIYLVLDRHVGRAGAVLGLAIAGLFSAHPALWANWGRFTQLSSVVLLPIAWAFFLETVLPPVEAEEPAPKSRQRTWLLIFAATTSAAVFLFHFRVGVFYLLLLGVTAGVILLKYRSRERQWLTIRWLLVTVLGMLIIVLPTRWDATEAFLAPRLAPADPADPAIQEQARQSYYSFPLSSVPYLVAPIWLLALGGLAGLIGLITRNVLIWIRLLWTLLMSIVGNLYLLNIPALNITNLGAVLIMLYIPISVIIGAGLEEGLRRLPRAYLVPSRAILAAAILAGGVFAAWNRAKAVEPYRHFVTDQDITAMQWIDENIPSDATFAINTYRWLPQAIHGTDAGYWIPYFTGRQIVTSAMLRDGLPDTYRKQSLDRSEAAEALETDLSALGDLRRLGVEYIYIGAIGDFSGDGLQLERLTQSNAVEVLYSKGDTAVLRILAAEAE